MADVLSGAKIFPADAAGRTTRVEGVTQAALTGQRGLPSSHSASPRLLQGHNHFNDAASGIEIAKRFADDGTGHLAMVGALHGITGR